MRYEIGGISVEMTEAQAERWNSGDTTDYDLDTIRVSLPDEYAQQSSVRDGEVVMHAPRLVRSSRQISLRRAVNRRLSPETASAMDGMPANLIG